MIHLIDVDPGNWRFGLKVSESQKHYVSEIRKPKNQISSFL